VAHGRKLDLKQPVVAAQAVVPLPVLVLLPGRRLVELQQEVLRRLARQLLRVPPQPVWL
jgi:hypothetical protein